MTRPIAVLRPEPGNAVTVTRLAAAGLHPIALPLFETRALAWKPPDPRNHDAIMFTSANALRLGGIGLGAMIGLPALTVGAATAEAARTAGYSVCLTGRAGAPALAIEALAAGYRRVLHVSGHDAVSPGAPVTCTIAVYESVPRDIGIAEIAAIAGSVALLHSARAAARFARLAAAHRDRIAIAALSRAVASAAGDGWSEVAFAAKPTDAALIAVARCLAD